MHVSVRRREKDQIRSAGAGSASIGAATLGEASGAALPAAAAATQNTNISTALTARPPSPFGHAPAAALC